MSITARQHPCKAVSETLNCSFSFAEVLDSSELLTGTPTVTEVDTSDLTISNVAVNAAAIEGVDDKAVAIGKAVVFTVAGGNVANSPYKLQIQAVSDASNAQTLRGNGFMIVVAD